MKYSIERGKELIFTEHDALRVRNWVKCLLRWMLTYLISPIP